MFRPLLTIDFDGVLNSYKSGWEGVDVINDPPNENAINFLLAVLPAYNAETGQITDDKGLSVAIFSSRCRDESGVMAIKRWLKRWGLPDYYIDHGILRFTAVKEAGFLHIDDRAWTFRGEFPSLEDVKSFKPWWKQGGP